MRPGSAQISGIEACGPRHFISGFISFFLVAFAILLPASTTAASASNVYISQNGTGTGTSCSDTLPVFWFNNSANWGSGSTQIGPGTTAHLCGTFTASSVGTTELTVQGSGASGNPVTILFESGAVLTSPAWPNPGGAINLNSQSYIVVDGGTNGVIQNTANGTNFANHINSTAVYAANTFSCIIKNLRIFNIYVHVPPGDAGLSHGSLNAITYYPPATNLTVANNTIHDCGWCLNGYGNGLLVYGNEVYNMDHGMAIGVGSGSYGNMVIHDNHFHDYTAWDTVVGGGYHHDGIHAWGENGGSITNIMVYNNLFDGDVGISVTAHLYFEQTVQNGKVFNNVFLPSPNKRDYVCIWLDGYAGALTNTAIYNNFLNTSGGKAAIYVVGGTNLSAGNNILIGTNANIALAGGATLATMDYNVYRNNGNGNNFGWQGANTDSLATWQTKCSCDSRAIETTTSDINAASDGHLQVGSVAVGAGVNLTSLGIGSLKIDKDGALRPTSGPWSAGAYQYPGVGSRPAPPTGLTVTVH